MERETNHRETIAEIRDLVTGFGDKIILDGLSLDIRRSETLAIVGGSGSGKSTLLRTIIGLLPKKGGTIRLFGQDVDGLDEIGRRAIERRWGVMFQRGALFSSLTLMQNLQFQMREVLDISQRLMDEMAIARLQMVGLSGDDAYKMPSELSGGMIKRAALARALALDPELVFLDEPTSGLDPISAGEFDQLIRTLQRTMGISVVMVTHDLQSLYAITDRVAVISGGKVVADGPVETMSQSGDPWVQAYFFGTRGSAFAAGPQHSNGRG